MELLRNCLFCYREEGVLYRKDGVFVQLDDAPIVEGHVLILPDLHYPSVADAPASVLESLDHLTSNLSRMYLEEYGSFTFFEHGRTGHCIMRNPGERVCHHAHIHFLPLPGDLTENITLGQRVEWQSWHEVAALAKDLEGYLTVGTSGAGRQFYPVSRPLPSHYLRSRASDLVGDSELADWETQITTERSRNLVDQAYRRLHASFDGTLAGRG